MNRLGWAPLVLAVVSGAGLVVPLITSPHEEQRLGGFATPLTGRMASQRHNAELCIEKLSGAVIEPGEIFSFNEHVGPWSRDLGYRKAPVSYNGQLINAWGGGVCQTSTTLYNAALLAGLPIVERHPHQFSPSYAPPGRDAAVAYRNVDLRFANSYAFPIRIVGRVRGDRLEVHIVGRGHIGPSAGIETEVRSLAAPQTFGLRRPSPRARVRNTGKTGYEVLTWRLMGEERELVSVDSYPAMNRIIEYR